MDPGAIHPQESALGPRGIREREATALDSRKEILVSLSANHAPGAVPALDPCPRLRGGEDTEAPKRGVAKIRTELWPRRAGMGGGPLRDGAVALLCHLLQQPWRRNLLAEEVPGVRGQPEVAVDERHEGQRGRQPRELGLL